MANEYFLTEFDVYRLGNSTSPRLDHVRVPRDIPTFFVGQVEHVQPGIAGVSLMDQAGLEKRVVAAKKAGSTVGHVWRIAKGVALPFGLVMREDPANKTHLLLGPATNTPIEKFRGLLLELAARGARTSESGDRMPSTIVQLDLDQRAAGQVLESIAERLLRLERLREDEIDEDGFADAKNDAVALRPLYEQLRQRAVQTFGKSILSFSDSIGELDAIYGL